MSSHICCNNPDNFCYICGSYAVSKQRQDISDFVVSAYHAYFNMEIANMDQPWVPHKVCRTCVEHLRLWKNGKRKSMPFAIPMVWGEPLSPDDCYFCLINVRGYHAKSKKEIIYPNIPSAIRPIPHGENLPIPDPPPIEENPEPKKPKEKVVKINALKIAIGDSIPRKFSETEFDDLVKELNLSNECAELLASRLKSKNLIGEEGVAVRLQRRKSPDLAANYYRKIKENGADEPKRKLRKRSRNR